MAAAGDIVEISYNHPSLGAGFFYPKSAEDSTYDLGGLRKADDAQNVDGAGRPIRVMNRSLWSFEVAISWDMNDNSELDVINALAADPVDADFTFTHINGTVYAGKGTIVGEVQGNGNAGTISFKVNGGGILKQI